MPSSSHRTRSAAASSSWTIIPASSIAWPTCWSSVPWPWRLNPGWWAGYAELQYYPPGAAYAGALLHVVSLGTLGAERAYQMLLWGIFVLPGAATYWLLARVLGSAWLALPGAFVALTLSGRLAQRCRGGAAVGADRRAPRLDRSCPCWRSRCGAWTERA